MSPKYLADQLERSLRNFGVAAIDVFYLHNPETQLTEVSAPEFEKRIRAAFLFLESAAANGKIGAYGMATWNAFREDPKSPGYLSLEAMAAIAEGVGGTQHRFRFVQLPFNLAMPEALTRPNQTVAGKTMPMVQAARDLGINLVTSAALLQGHAQVVLTIGEIGLQPQGLLVSGYRGIDVAGRCLGHPEVVPMSGAGVGAGG